MTDSDILNDLRGVTILMQRHSVEGSAESARRSYSYMT